MVRNWSFLQPWLCYKVSHLLQLNPCFFGVSEELQDPKSSSPGHHILGISSHNILSLSPCPKVVLRCFGQLFAGHTTKLSQGLQIRTLYLAWDEWFPQTKDMSKSSPPESVRETFLEVEFLQIHSSYDEVIRMGSNPITGVLVVGNVDTEMEMHRGKMM